MDTPVQIIPHLAQSWQCVACQTTWQQKVTPRICPNCGAELPCEIAPLAEMFPTAMVPGAQSVAEVFEGWKKRGFTPREMTREELIQRIEITHDPLDGQLKWTSQNLDGLGAIMQTLNVLVLMPCLLVGNAAKSISEYFTSGAGRIDLGSGEAGVMIAFKNGKLAMDWTPRDSPSALKKLLAAAFIFAVARDAKMDITEEVLRLFDARQ